MLLAGVAVSSFVVPQPSTVIQGGTPPIKIKGPTIITSDSKRSAAYDSPDSTYEYEVDLAQTSVADTVVHISDLTDAAEPVGYSVTIPAGSKVGYFSVNALIPGIDVIVATSSVGTAVLSITVL
jgi:hypothetical protein